MSRVTLVGRRTAHERCAICHGALRDREARCRECGSLVHQDCRRELGRCPTLGCAAVDVTHHAPTSPRRSSIRARFGPYFRILLRASACLVGLAGSIAFLAWPLLSWRSFIGLGVFSALVLLLVALVGVIRTGVWLAETPGLLRAVRRLLHTSVPVPLWLTVAARGPQDYVAVFEETDARSGKSFEIPLDVSLAPGWLCRLEGRHRVYVYGVGADGPCLVEFPDGRLALVRGPGVMPIG